MILIWLNALFMPIGLPHGCYPLDLRVLAMHVTHVGFYVEHVGLPGCSRLCAGIMLGWGVVGVWMGMFADWAVGPCCFTGEWLLDVGCGNTLARTAKV